MNLKLCWILGCIFILISSVNVSAYKECITDCDKVCRPIEEQFIPYEIMESMDGEEVIDQQQTEYCGWGYGGLRATVFAQSFMPTLKTLTKVVLLLFKRGSPPGLKVSIRDELRDEDLASAYIDDIVLAENKPYWIEFDFENVSVTPGQQYYIIWDPYLGDADNSFFWCFGINNPYGYGQAYHCLSGSWEKFDDPDFPEMDFCFKMYGINNPPNQPTINGHAQGKPGIEFEFTIMADDPEGQNVFYEVKWGDGSFEESIGPCQSGEEKKVKHSWDEKGTYLIEVRAKDTYSQWSNWTTFEMVMQKGKETNQFTAFFERLANFFPFLDEILNHYHLI